MSLHQIQFRYDEAEDRLLLRMSTTDNCEFRFWLTRRFTKRLWKLLTQMLEWDRAVKQQVDPQARHAVLDIQHEGYARQADYSKPFEERPQEAPRRMLLGEAPVLLSRARGRKQNDGTAILSLHPPQGNGIDITVDPRLLHVFTKALREQVEKTDWEVNLALYEGASATDEADTQPRTLN